MGLVSSSGSLARVAGPIFVSYIYQAFGTYLTMVLSLVGLIIGLVLLLAAYRRLVPFHMKRRFGKTKMTATGNNDDEIEMDVTKL